MDKFRNLEKIGDGTYGTVIKSVDNQTSIYYNLILYKKNQKIPSLQ